MYNIIFFGPPGAGKGTQAKIISEYLDIAHLSTGDILRKKLLDKDNLANELMEIMSSGKLVSDAILNSIVALRLKNEVKDAISMLTNDKKYNNKALKNIKMIHKQYKIPKIGVNRKKLLRDMKQLQNKEKFCEEGKKYSQFFRSRKAV